MGRALAWVNPHAAHERHIEHQAAIAHGKSRNIVTAALDGQAKAVLAREVHARHHVGHAEAACDERRPTVDHGVPDRTRLVVAGLAGEQDWTPQTRSEIFNGISIEHVHLLFWIVVARK
jgi:hypothetical protein